MSPRFKVALAVLGALALATAALWVALGGVGGKRPAPKRTDVAGVGRGATDGNQPTATVEGADAPGLAGSGDGTQRDPTPSGAGIPSGLRDPSGLDLSDPKVVKELLSQHLAEPQVDWQAVVELVKILQEPLDPDMRRRFLEELRVGHRVGVLAAFEVLQDGSLAPDLLQMLDDTQLSAPARQAALQALSRMPGADAGEVVRGLESRVTGEPRHDQLILQAIAIRGGKEAARALVQYLQGSVDPRRIQTYILQRIDLAGDAQAAQVVADALQADQKPDTLRALLDLAAKPGAKVLAEPLISLNRDGVPDDVRQAAIASLGRVGTDRAVEYLLTLAQQPGPYGEVALRSIGGLADAPKEALDRLVEAAQQASRAPRPEDTKEQILLALGTMKHVPALPMLGDSLKDGSLKVRLSAVRGLGRLGTPARTYVPELVNLYATGDDTMRRQVILALGSIGGESAKGALEQMSSDAKLTPSMQRTVNVALSQMQAATPDDVDASGAPVPALGGR